MVKAKATKGQGGGAAAAKKKEAPEVSKASTKAQDECYKRTIAIVEAKFADVAKNVDEKRYATATKMIKRTQKTRVDAEKYMELSVTQANELTTALTEREKELHKVAKKLDTVQGVIAKMEKRSKQLKELAMKTAKEAHKEFAEVASKMG